MKSPLVCLRRWRGHLQMWIIDQMNYGYDSIRTDGGKRPTDTGHTIREKNSSSRSRGYQSSRGIGLSMPDWRMMTFVTCLTMPVIVHQYWFMQQRRLLTEIYTVHELHNRVDGCQPTWDEIEHWPVHSTTLEDLPLIIIIKRTWTKGIFDIAPSIA